MALKLLPQHSLLNGSTTTHRYKHKRVELSLPAPHLKITSTPLNCPIQLFGQNNQKNTLKRTTKYDSDTMIRVVPKTQRVQVFQTSVAYPCQV